MVSEMNWQQYEDEVFNECSRIYKDAEIIRNTHVDGVYSKRKRQIDVLIKNALINGERITIVVDAKYYKTKVDIKEAESFISMLKDTQADRGLLITEMGFTKSAINRVYLGEDNLDVDILSLKDLQQFQGYGAFPYAGNWGVFMQPPFGWIIDGKRNIDAPATLYRRGFTFEEACENKEFMYVQIYSKDDDVTSIDDLIRKQNDDTHEYFPNATIKVDHSEYKIRSIKIETYPTTEYTGYKEFEDFILFIVLFSPDLTAKKNISKMKFSLDSALPIGIRHKKKINY